MIPSHFVIEFLDGTHVFVPNKANISLTDFVIMLSIRTTTPEVDLLGSVESIAIDYSLIYRVSQFVDGYATSFVSTTIWENYTRFDLTDGTAEYLIGRYTHYDVRIGTVPAWFKHSVSEIAGTAYYGYAGIYEEWYRIEPKVAKITMTSGRVHYVAVDGDWDEWVDNFAGFRLAPVAKLHQVPDYQPTGQRLNIKTAEVESISEVER